MPATEPGAARQFPTGRLAGFEDADDDAPVREAGYLGAILQPRAPRPAQPHPQDPGSTLPAVPAEPTPAAGTESTAAAAETATSTATPVTEPASASPLTDPAIRTTKPRTARPRRPRPAATGQQPAATTATPATNPVRASNVHIPASFMARIELARTTHRLSNGELVVAALEAAHSKLGELINAPAATGGSLFAPRVTRTARVHEGPLTPFNIRLREADYRVIDQLVTQFGASSRGHLITVAFDEYLPTT